MVGMRYFFQNNKEEDGIEQLKSAISKGHQVAKYGYGPILVCHGWDPRMKAQTSLFSQLSQLGTVECNGMPIVVSAVFVRFLGA
ncbi:hypothetical protein C1H46_043932 [Malus baccata]|uniref:At2g35280-like TPR domain-containing protein n=1 Tax=Malus baccata TaxID=106549 RepID=A0A540K8H7_MALBA|nr:hypothetical protein C1H46_043932 [Malus baccata]